MKNPDIREEIENRLEEETLTANEALRLLALQATTSIDDILDEDGYLDLTKARKSGRIHAVKELEYWEHYSEDGTEKETRAKVKLYDAQSALKDIIDRLQGKAIQRSEITGKDGSAIIISTGMDVDDL